MQATAPDKEDFAIQDNDDFEPPTVFFENGVKYYSEQKSGVKQEPIEDYFDNQMETKN